MPEDERFKWAVALALFGILFLGVSDTQLVSPLLPLIAQDLNTTPGRAGTIVTYYALAAAVSALILGPISDQLGRKRVLAAGLALFSAASFLTYHTTYFNTLLLARMLTGLAAGTLSTCALAYAGDYYPYAQRGRAMGMLSMAYFLAFVIGVPLGSVVAARLGWRLVFAGLSYASVGMLFITLAILPADSRRSASSPPALGLVEHFQRRDRVAGIVAAFLTSGGIVGFLTYVGAWLKTSYDISVDRIGLLFIAAGIAGIAAAPLAGWLSDRAGKKKVIVWSNLSLAALFLAVSQMEWGLGLAVGVGLLSLAASARQAPLHALTTEIVGMESRGGYVAVRNAASQLGIATVATVSAFAFDLWGFSAVAVVAAVVTILIPLVCRWIEEPR